MRWIRVLLRSSRLVLWLALIFILWQAWVFWRPRPRSYSESERAALREVYALFVEVLAGGMAGSEGADGPVRFGVAHFVGDPSDQVTKSVRSVLAVRDDWTVEESSVIQKFLGDVSKAVAKATSLDELVHAGRRVELDVIVAGRVVEIKEEAGVARAELDLCAYDVRSGRWLHRDKLAASCRAAGKGATSRGMKRLAWPFRLLLWLLFAGLLPWVTPFATRWAIERKSNLASFALVTGYTAVDLLLAMALSGFSIVGTGHGFLLLGAFLLCAGYNYWVCERMAGRP